MSRSKTIRIHSKLSHSRANGPGLRTSVWLQGCPFRCANCFNNGLNDTEGETNSKVNELFQWLVSIHDVSGVTLSGGEPTEQIPALITFLTRIKQRTDLSILLFSGRTLEDIIALTGGKRLISFIDVLIDGKYDHKQANPPGIWPSSANQKIHFLTKRYTIKDFTNLPMSEVIIQEDGEVVESGIFGHSRDENSNDLPTP